MTLKNNDLFRIKIPKSWYGTINEKAETRIYYPVNTVFIVNKIDSNGYGYSVSPIKNPSIKIPNVGNLLNKDRYEIL